MLDGTACAKKQKKRKDHALRRQLDEKPSIISGCPGAACVPNDDKLHDVPWVYIMITHANIAGDSSMLPGTY